MDNCRLSLNAFLDKVRKYERCLSENGSGSLVKDSTRKIQWQISKKDVLEKLRAEVVGHCQSINMLIATAQV